MPKPNIVLLFVDQMRGDAMGCVGNPHIRTPNLDRLAASGVCFTQASTHVPVCIAARYGWMTGRRCAQTGRHANNDVYPEPNQDTIMMLLGQNGYVTHAVGKMHHRPPRRHYGFHKVEFMEEIPPYRHDDDYAMYLKDVGYGHVRQIHGVRNLLYTQPQTSPVPEEHVGSTWVADRSVEFIRDSDERPFFLYSSWIAPHPPFNVPESFMDMYDEDALPLPTNWDRPEQELPVILRMLRHYADFDNATPQRMRRIKALYYAQISLIDKGVGRILDALEETGKLDNTLILFASDHGEMLGDQRACQKSNPYDSCARIPLLLSHPGHTEAGRASDELVNLLDIFPTFAQAAEIQHPVLQELPGQSLLSQPGGGLAQDRAEIATELGVGRSRWLSLRRHDLKYNYYLTDGFEELYDLQADPTEGRNLLHDSADGEARKAADEMKQRLETWEADNGFENSFEDGALRNFGETEPVLRRNDQFAVWPDHVSLEEAATLETPGESTVNAVRHETTFTLDELDLAFYKEHGGTLEGTQYEHLLDDV